MQSWKPDIFSAHADLKILVDFFHQATCALFEYAGKLNHDEEYQKALDYFHSMYSKLSKNPGAIYYPCTFEWHYTFKKILKTENPDLNCIINHLESIEQLKTDIQSCKRNRKKNLDVHNIPVCIDILRPGKFKQTIFNIKGGDTLRYLDRLSSQDKGNIIEALKLIQSVWPEFYTEFLIYIRQINIHGSTGEKTCFSALYSQGLINIDIGYFKGGEPFKWAEYIVHEGAHVRLAASMIFQKYYTNGREVAYETPLRKDKRPMYGLFHQIFVIVRLVEFYRRLKDAGYDVQEQLNHHMRDLELGLGQLTEQARLTPEGFLLVGSMIDYARNIIGLKCPEIRSLNESTEPLAA